MNNRTRYLEQYIPNVTIYYRLRILSVAQSRYWAKSDLEDQTLQLQSISRIYVSILKLSTMSYTNAPSTSYATTCHVSNFDKISLWHHHITDHEFRYYIPSDSIYFYPPSKAPSHSNTLFTIRSISKAVKAISCHPWSFLDELIS